MLTRRSFLVSAGAFTLGQIVSGCSRPSEITVHLLRNSIPPQLLGEFRQQLERRAGLNFQPVAQIENVLELLRTWQERGEGAENGQRWSPFRQRAGDIADLVTLGDSWLTQAIQENLIQPLEIEQLSGWNSLPARWQELVRRDSQGQLNETGQIWGAPYRWGTTMIVYSQERFNSLGWTPRGWEDLWREELRDRISMIDQPREVIGFTLKKLGHSYNTENLEAIPNLREELLALNSQVRFYSSDTYLQPLVLGDTWVAVGWSTDILPLLRRYRQLRAIIPPSGTSLWTDLWVQPNSPSDSHSPLASQWIDFCWQPRSASQISLFTTAISPAILNLSPSDLPRDLQNNSLLRPESTVLEKSEFLLPLPSESLEQYLALWQDIRTNT